MGKIALMFSGQGAQYPGMGKELYECSPAAKAVFEMAEALRPGTIRQCFEGTAEELSITRNTQPCVFTMDLAAAEAVREAGIVPDFAAGFSLGELAALAFTGVLAREDAFRVILKRAALMDDAAQKHPGAMFAVLKLKAQQVQELCVQCEEAYPVNFNCPGQTVVACRESDAGTLTAAVKEAGGKAVRLAVSGAFHSPFMHEAALGMAEALKEFSFHTPEIPVYANVTAAPYEGDMAATLASQTENPVLWQKTVEAMAKAGADAFIEVGPGKTLCGLVKKTIKGAPVYKIENKEDLEAAKSALRIGL